MTIDIINYAGVKPLFSEVRFTSVVPVDIVEIVPADSCSSFFDDRHAYLFDTSVKTIPLSLCNKHNVCAVIPKSFFDETNMEFQCDVAVYDDNFYSSKDILSAMRTALEEERFINEFKLSVSSLFFNGADIDSLASYSYEKLHYPIAVLDSSANLLYGKGFSAIQDDPIVSCLISDGMISHELFSKYNFTELHRKLSRSINPFVDKTAGLRERLHYRIMSGRNLIGQITFISLDNKQFSHVDSECIKALASAISIKIQSSDSEYRLVSREALLHDLISGQLRESSKLTKYNINQNDFSTGKEYYLVVIDHQIATEIHTGNIGSRGAMQRVHFSEWFPDVRFICQYEGHMVALVGKPFLRKSLKQLRDYLKTYSLRAAVSNLMSDVFSAYVYYDQCIEMLNFAAEKKPPVDDDNLLVFQQCFSWLITEKAKKKIITQAYVLPEWAALIEYDRKYQTQYVATLSAYLHHNTIIKAAKALYIHKNTFMYRMEKIQNILGRPISAEDRYNLYLSEFMFN